MHTIIVLLTIEQMYFLNGFVYTSMYLLEFFKQNGSPNVLTYLVVVVRDNVNAQNETKY